MNYLLDKVHNIKGHCKTWNVILDDAHNAGERLRAMDWNGTIIA